MASRLFNTVTSFTKIPSVLGRRYVHTNPGFQKYTSRLGATLPNGGLAEPYPGVPEGNVSHESPSTTNITTLPNGVRVVSLSSPSPSAVATLGVYVTSGSRHETPQVTGATHILKHMALTSTHSRRAIQVVRDIESLGANFSITAGREHLLFESEVVSEDAPKLVPLIADMLHPRLAYYELDRTKKRVQEESEQLTEDPVASLFELLHSEAFRSRGLGHPLVVSPYNLNKIDYAGLSSYVNTSFTAGNTVVAASGIPHNQLVELVQQSFEGLTQRGTSPTKREASEYTGGEVRVAHGGSSHIALAFEGVSLKDSKDAAALGVLQQLLGGGSRFSRDGPGVGYTSRLYSNVVQADSKGLVQEVVTFNLPYTDTGLFGVYVHTKAEPALAINAVASELTKVLSLEDATEVARAKAVFKASILSDKRVDLVRAIAEQAVAGQTTILTSQQRSTQVDDVTLADVKRVASKVLSSNPTLVVLGDVTGIPHVSAIKKSISEKVTK